MGGEAGRRVEREQEERRCGGRRKEESEGGTRKERGERRDSERTERFEEGGVPTGGGMRSRTFGGREECHAGGWKGGGGWKRGGEGRKTQE